jgi:hypothetical protein
MPTNIIKGAFFSSNLTITANTTYSSTTPEKPLENIREMTVSVKATGANASSSGTVTAAFQVNVGDNNWTTSEMETVTCALSGTASVVGLPKILNVNSMTAIRVSRITNGDATYAISGVNVIYDLVNR